MSTTHEAAPDRPLLEYDPATDAIRTDMVTLARLFMGADRYGVDPADLSDEEIRQLLDLPQTRRTGASRGVVDRPARRLLRTSADAELAARDHLRWLGFADAELTGDGTDADTDVAGTNLVAQVKLEGRASTRGQLQLLTGAAAVKTCCQTAFFSLSGYTPDARSWAHQAAMALFTFDLHGRPIPANARAQDLVDHRLGAA